MASVIDPRKVAATNPAVEPDKIEAAQAFHQALERAGIVGKPDYRISSPLAGDPSKPAPKGPHVVRMRK